VPQVIDLKQRIAEMDATASQSRDSLSTPMIIGAMRKFPSLSQRRGTTRECRASRLSARLVASERADALPRSTAIDELIGQANCQVCGCLPGHQHEGATYDDPLFEAVFARIEALDLPFSASTDDAGA